LKGEKQKRKSPQQQKKKVLSALIAEKTCPILSSTVDGTAIRAKDTPLMQIDFFYLFPQAKILFLN
jgi:hypothetical protein